jgi:glycosyltransferase involved in cell wall biosynthesis
MAWIVSQLGSREHYAVGRALHGAGALGRMFTDVWVRGADATLLSRISPSLAARRHEGVPDDLVVSAGFRRLAVDGWSRLRRLGGWDVCIQRNNWYAAWAAGRLKACEAGAFFSYSYTARQPFEEAKRHGMRCILDQIDGAWREEQLWRELSAPYHGIEAVVDQAPPLYWERWNEELQLADTIVVNSKWSKKLIVEAGAEERKIVEIPLVYSREAGSVGHGAEGVGYSPDSSVSAGQSASFPKARLRALFLGSVCLRKGVGQLLDAIRMLKHESVDFAFAGPVGVRVPDDIRAMPHVRFLGPVDRATAERLYGEADVFLFPTLSDGFGRTQLEALGHGCPVIASKNCAHVVENRVNGLVLEEVTPDNIAEKIMALLRDCDLLAQLKANARVPDKFHPRHLAPALLALEH